MTNFFWSVYQLDTDVKEVFPQVIDTNEDGFLGVRYVELVPVLVKAIQELSAKVSLLENK